MKNLFVTLVAGVMSLSAFASQPPPVCSKQSPAYTVALIELYTSEGCSSCPPADRFLRSLRNGTGPAAIASEQVVPLALHVDYWDYIGWKDVYAKRDFTERQRWLAAQAGTKTVYTPEFFIGGLELRNWSSGAAAAVKRINAQPARADIAIEMGKPAEGKLPVVVRAKSSMTARLFVVLYENGLTSVVRSGENQGATLQHDYVAREWLAPVELAEGDSMKKVEVSRQIAMPQAALGRNLGVAAFVQHASGGILQAISLDLCEGL